jgi:uncharacterized protein
MSRRKSLEICTFSTGCQARRNNDVEKENSASTTMAESSILTKPLQAVTRLAVRFPKATIAVAMVVTVAAVALTASRLGFRNSRADLLNPHSPYHQRWLAYIKEFGDQEDIVVVVQSKQPNGVLSAMEDVAAALEGQPKLFQAILWRYDLSRLRGKGLHYLSFEQLQAVNGFLDRAAPILQGDWNALNAGRSLEKIAMGMEMLAATRRPMPPEMLSGLDSATGMLAAALTSPGVYRSPWNDAIAMPSQIEMLGSRPLTTSDGKLGFVTLKLGASDRESFDPHAKGIAMLRQIIDKVGIRHPDAAIGITGLPVIENDEMTSSQTDMGYANVLSFLGVAFVFVAGFGGWRHPVIGNLALMAGMAWAFGFATLAIGHLNILSSAFGAILVGQGIDFGVYYLAGYLQQRRQTDSSAAALVETAGCVGPGIATGAISTAIAFFAAGFTEFTGVAETGIIAGGGILLCFLAAIFLLPSMIQLSDANRPLYKMPTQLELGGLLNKAHAIPFLPLFALAAVTILATVGMQYLHYDHNLMNMQPRNLESVRLAKMLMERTGQDAYYALSIAENREQALLHKKEFLQQPSVARVEEIASVMPNVEPRCQTLIQQIHARLAHLPATMPQVAAIAAPALGDISTRLLGMLPAQAETIAMRKNLSLIQDSVRHLTTAEIGDRINCYQQRLVGDIFGRFKLLQSTSDPAPPRWSDLPDGLTTRFIGHSGKMLLKVYSKADIWDMPATERFINEVRGVDEDATGNPMQIYESSRQMRSSYEHAAIYAMIVVILVVYLDFGDLWHTFLGLLPLGLGMLQMFGLMGLLDIPLNAANMIVLPLILGIGVDNGVHVVHDYRRQRFGDYRLSDSTANAVFINSVGNMVGFGSLMIASHRGLQSLGRVLTIGMACCLFSALALPGLLVLLRRIQPKRRTPARVAAARMQGPHATAATTAANTQ